MESVKDKIQKIKFSRMGKEYQFVAEMFSDLESHKSKSKPNHVYFLKNDIPVMVYDKKAHYLWCHNNIIWEPLLKIMRTKMSGINSTNREEIIEMRKILGRFALGYFNMSEVVISMAHSYITCTWETLKFRRVYVW